MFDIFILYSAEYFQLIYGDRESSHGSEAAKFADTIDGTISNQKLSLKLKNVMSIRTGTVEGVEATEIPVWDALDHPLIGSSSYYSSMTVKLRKERGQDLDPFMQAFFDSIEQDADLGEDIASTQTEDERNRLRMKLNNHGNVELYKNLFNIPQKTRENQFMVIPLIKSSVDSAIYFFASILNVNKVILRIVNGVLKMLPEADHIINQLIRKFVRKTLDEATLAKLINELEEKVFDPNPTVQPSASELTTRRLLAESRLESLNRNSVKILSFLQNPVLNKHLVYCLIDVIAVELFPEFNLEAKES